MDGKNAKGAAKPGLMPVFLLWYTYSSPPESSGSRTVLTSKHFSGGWAISADGLQTDDGSRQSFGKS